MCKQVFVFLSFAFSSVSSSPGHFIIILVAIRTAVSVDGFNLIAYKIDCNKFISFSKPISISRNKLHSLNIHVSHSQQSSVIKTIELGYSFFKMRYSPGVSPVIFLNVRRNEIELVYPDISAISCIEQFVFNSNLPACSIRI